MSDKTASARPHGHVTTNAGVDEGAAISIRLVESPVHGGMHIVEWHNLGGLRPGYHRLYAAPSPAPVCEECGKAEQCFDCAVAEAPVQAEPNSSGHSEDARHMLPSVQQLAEALNGVQSFHDLSAELIAPTLRANLIAAIGEPASDLVPVPREFTNQCAETCERARLCATCAGVLGLPGLPEPGSIAEARIPHHTSDGRQMLWTEVEVIAHAIIQGVIYSWVKEPGESGGFYAPMMLSFRALLNGGRDA